jgi:hypothetical protein
VNTVGDALNVRAAPSAEAPVVGQIGYLDVVWVEAFVLTEAWAGPQRPGHGWHLLGDPIAGRTCWK